jgi:uncharacterized protein YbjT (DUF2867 family)
VNFKRTHLHGIGHVNVLLLGATGMVGQGVLRESLIDADVQRVTTLGRSGTGQRNDKLRELIHANLLDLTTIESQLSGYDACLYCLGISSVGLSEEEYTKVTYAMAMSVAQTLVKLNPQMTFVFVSGASADSSEHGRVMWARVKGRTENALMRLPFKGVYVFRPGLILPMHGIKSRTGWYNIIYALLRPLVPVFRAVMPVTTTEQIGRAMLKVSKLGFDKQIIEAGDIGRV